MAAGENIETKKSQYFASQNPNMFRMNLHYSRNNANPFSMTMFYQLMLPPYATMKYEMKKNNHKCRYVLLWKFHSDAIRYIQIQRQKYIL